MKRFLPLVCAILLVLTVSWVPSHSFAGETMAYKLQEQASMYSGSGSWKRCAGVVITPPKKGYVVVTASGMAAFDHRDSSLTLTLSTNNGKGPWIFSLSPGTMGLQTYTVRMVFPVTGGTAQRFNLNGASYDGPGGTIKVQTGSITAEFYPSANVTKLVGSQSGESLETSGPVNP
ncbi:MAG TPA: hypothetical protein PLM79_04160 [Syntrophobacteraceae bacterium]|nr:hypothetical protein [Syntrophobacteraceae bacterium]